MSIPAPTVYVVDDDVSFLTAVARLLRAGGYAVKLYSSADAFVKDPPPEPVGCVIVDLHMPGMDGMELQEVLARSSSPLPVIFLTGHGDIATSVHAMRKGAEDFLTKPVNREKLFEAVQRALVRNALQRAAGARDRELRALYETLTPREREVMTHVVAGRLNKQIAADIDAAERTVKAHRASIMAKLRVQSVADLVRLSQSLGL
ncbi:MAG: response regulator [Opitutaceae bacterium]|jgi:FixJ family two-component response regulator|nr:response regulator [Opitutaceae bacterium]